MVVPQRAQAAPRVQGDQRLGFRVFWRGGHGVKHPTRRNSGRCVRILVSFSSLVYGIAAVSDGAVARRIQPAVVRVCGGGTSDRGVLFLPTLTSLFVFPLFFLFFLSQVSRPMQPVRRCETARLPPQPQHWLLRGLVSVLGSYLWNRSELPNVLGAKGTDGGKGKVVLKQQKRQQQKDKKAILVWILMISCSNSNR